MADGHGPVSGLLEAVYTGDVSASKEGFLRYQLLKLGGGSDSEGPNEVDSDEDWGADPVAAFEASKRHEVKPKEPSALEMKAHRAMVNKEILSLNTEGCVALNQAGEQACTVGHDGHRDQPVPMLGKVFQRQNGLQEQANGAMADRGDE